MSDNDISSILGSLQPKVPRNAPERPSVAAPNLRGGTVPLGKARPSESHTSSLRVIQPLDMPGQYEEPVYTNPSAAPVRPPEEPVNVILEEPNKVPTVNLDSMLTWMLDNGGSDLFLAANLSPSSKINGERVPIEGYGPLTDSEVEQLVYSILNNRQRQRFEETKELDCSYSIPGKSRFRVNVFRATGSVSAVLRAIPFEIKPIGELGLPMAVANHARHARGLVLVTGPTGSGKSTTLAALIDDINRNKKGHILTIEDPIEFVHTHRGCIVNQREVGTDTESFSNALRAALREAPDYILVGEMRDYETIALAITLAETGHLVFGTLHTNSAPETISRIVDVFPAEQQEQIKTQLASTLQAVICQNLVRTADGNARIAAVEIMTSTNSVRAKIRKGRLESLVSDLQTGQKHGMQTMDSHLEQLAKDGIITAEMAVDKAHRRSEMEDALAHMLTT